MKKALLIFAKNPIYGEVKTRLAATIGDARTLTVYHHLLNHTVRTTCHLSMEKTVFYSKYIEEKDVWNNMVYFKQVQSGYDLGQRMEHAFAGSFDRGNERVAIIGTDCLEITSTIISDAFNYLDDHDVVLGPAKDGGYYLLAMKSLHSELFRNITWSTDLVLKQTLKKCEEKYLSTYLLPELSDIDDFNDLEQKEELMKIVQYD